MLHGKITYIRFKKIASNLALHYRAKQLLNKECLKNLSSYIHSYLHYVNITWIGGTYYTKLKTIRYQEKHEAQIIFN